MIREFFSRLWKSNASLHQCLDGDAVTAGKNTAHLTIIYESPTSCIVHRMILHHCNMYFKILV